jgi:signal transduction histidine kinase/DNA-binding response OmpR family regulator
MTLEEQGGFGWTKRLVPEDVEPFFEKWNHCVATGEPWDYEHRIIDRYGDIHTVLTRGLPVHDEVGEFKAWVGVNLDITARKQMEVELKQAKEELEKALTIKDQFVANISHELRTPLALILEPVRKMLAAGNLQDDERRDLEVVERNARTLLRHVNDLLDLSKLQVGKMEADYARVNLAWLVRVVTSLFENVAAERQISFDVDTPAELSSEVDPEKIQRVLLNLLANAFKFTPNGGKVDVRLKSGNGIARIAMSDSGPGIPVDQREAVFERFRQLDAGAARLKGGTGLGLAIVKEFISLHQGQVSVDDAPAGSAVFNVELPVIAPEGKLVCTQLEDLDIELGRQAVIDEMRIHERRVPVDVSDSLVNAPLVLVVEDNPDMCDYIAEAVGREYRVATAANGRDGLEKTLKFKPDLILSDIMMPEMSGDQMVREIRSHQEFDTTPIVLLTAKADDNMRESLLKDAVQDYIYKPFSTSEVLARVDRLIAERKKAEDETRRLQEAIRKERDTLSVLVSSIPDEIWFADTEKKFTLANPSALREFALDSGPDIDIERFAASLEVFRPDGSPRPVDEAPALRSLRGEVVRDLEEMIRIPTRGELRHRQVNSSPVKDTNGHIIGSVAVVRDITERKQMEEALRKSHDELELRVLERTAELKTYMARLEESNQALQDFASIAAHDLQEPLRKVKSFGSMLKQKCGPSLGEQERDYLKRILDANQRMQSLLTALLEYSRLSTKVDPFSAVDLTKIAQEVLSDLEVRIQRTGGEVQVGELPAVQADPTQMRQLFQNLIGNALKFHKSNEKPVIRVFCTTADNGDCQIVVEDNGIGFEEQYIERIFAPFQRLHGKSSPYEGTGMGLAICKKIVERHGGSITAKSTPGKGSSFMIELPRSGIMPSQKAS